MVFLKPTSDQIAKIKLLFQIFGGISRLKINLLKSELSITSSTASQTQSLADLIQCKASTFPITYLGLPLSNKRLTKADYMPIIDKLRAALNSWKASLLSIGGRIILLNAVLSTIPQYFMSTFLIPKWVVRSIDKIRRRFLWHGHKPQSIQSKALYMVNWTMATTPRKLGGLEIRNIQTANRALLMKWMWIWHNTDYTWWKQATIMADMSDKPWNDPQAPPFWKSLANIAAAFDCSTAYHIGNGLSTKFWHDNWTGTPLKWIFPKLFQLTESKHASVAHYRTATGWSLQFPSLPSTAHNEKGQLMLLLQQIDRDQIQTQSLDTIAWLRTPGNFSASSAHRFLSHTSSPHSNLQYIWHIKAPLKVKVFAWLLHTNCLTTIDNLVRRGWNLPNICTMCRSAAETVQHLFQLCPLTKQIRSYIFTALPSTQPTSPKFIAPNSTDMLLDPLENSNDRNWEIATCYILWRERCRRTFANQAESHLAIVREIKLEATAWFTH